MEDEMTAWLRRRIAERRYLARHAIELGNAAEWTELSSGVLMTVAPDAPQDAGGTWDGVHPLGDSSLTRLMEANDPRDTIARCETELAILGEHQPVPVRGMAWRGCGTCKDPNGGPAMFPCRTVRLLAYGYRHRAEGWKETWKP